MCANWDLSQSCPLPLGVARDPSSALHLLPASGRVVQVSGVKLGFESSLHTFEQVIDGGVGLRCFATSCLLARCCRPGPARSLWVAGAFAWTWASVSRSGSLVLGKTS